MTFFALPIGRLKAESAPEQSTLGGQEFIRADQSFKLSTKAAVFKKATLLIEGAKHVIGGASLPPLAPTLIKSMIKILKICFYNSVE